MIKDISIAFFGTPDRAALALETLKSHGIVPKLVITQPDRPQGRKFVMTPPPAKIWALKENIPVLQPDKLSEPAFVEALKKGDFDIFIVVAYGKIMPDSILSMPKHGSINLHGSLLPELRGASPIETAILQDKKDTGVTIIKMDSQVDHGPVIADKKIRLEEWPIDAEKLAEIVVTEGAKLIAAILPDWISGKIQAKEQDHSKATFTKKIAKEDALIDLSADSYQNLLKIKAYSTWPKAYFFDENKMRVVISDARIEDGKLVLSRVIPEGKREMAWEDYARGRKATR